MNELTIIQKIAVWALPVIFAITLHEVAHGWVASKFGDQTAKMLGRLTLNPIKHIDPIGTIVVPLALLFLGGFIFGWAKAVPVDTRNFKNPSRDMAWVAIAGPASNLIMAIIWAVIAKVGMVLQASSPDIGLFLIYSGLAGISINLILLVLNLIPIPPLDGSRVLSAFLPKKLSWQYNQLAPYGFFIILGLMFLGLLTPLLMGPYSMFKDMIFTIVGL
ncbi:site-2 protease family protein [Thiomicrorhabdus sp. Milos-T2]|uniref:site-2 protease family protein n=1 Tax=Thiomicrorhabdus sp. Milos-T2 TaxID=90814 RepID=UPI000493D687|nr:site-2 protease family protein [Thiomicrorhabdus sp. Milos-T2]